MLLPMAACKRNEEKEEKAETVSAAETLESVAEELGYENAYAELTPQTESTIGGDTYNRMQQNYKGIPVYGRSVIYVTEESGEISLVTGNALDVDDSIDLTPSVTEEQVAESIASYAVSSLGAEPADVEDLEIGELRQEDLCIYNLFGTKDTLAYTLNVGFYEFVVDAHTGEVLLADDQLRTATSVEGTLSGQRFKFNNVTYTQNDDGSFFLYDEGRNIEAYTVKCKQQWDRITQTWKSVWKEEIPVVWQEGTQPSKSVADAYINTQIVYDYFDVVLQNKSADGEGKTKIYVLDGVIDYKSGGQINSLLDNAMTHVNKEEGLVCISAGKAKSYKYTKGTYIDWIAHEYMHGVEQYHSGMVYEGQSGAVMEGLSDIFGELVEAWFTEEEPNWYFTETKRTMYDPNSSGHPAHKDDELLVDADYVHGYSTVISHTAYLMWNGMDGNAEKKLSETQLAELWYRAMLMMPKDCTFAECRTLVEQAAESINLTDAQKQCICEAFDKVGITETPRVDYVLDTNGTISVYDGNEEYYAGYTVQVKSLFPILDKKAGGRIPTSTMYEDSYIVEETGPHKLTLAPGFYKVTVSDREGNEVTISVQVGLRGDEDIPIILSVNDSLVEDAYSHSLSNGEYCYHVPKFVLSGDKANALNQEIYNELYNKVQTEALVSYEDYGYPWLCYMVYAWGKQGNIASTIVQTDYDSPHVTRYIYNVCTDTGEKATDAQVLAACGMNEQQYLAAVNETVAVFMEDLYKQWEPYVGAEWSRELVNNTLADISMETAKPFINEKGNLSANVFTYSPAGDEYEYYMFDLVLGEKMDDIQCKTSHKTGTNITQQDDNTSAQPEKGDGWGDWADDIVVESVVIYPVTGGNLYLGQHNGCEEGITYVLGADSTVTSAVVPSAVNNLKVAGVAYGAFGHHPNLEYIEFPAAATVDGAAFFGCTALKEIKCAKGNPACYTIDGVLYSTSLDFDGNQEVTLEKYPAAKEDKHFSIPEGVTDIGMFAFDITSNLETVSIPDTVEYISTTAFENATSIKEMNFAGSEEQWKAIDSNYDGSIRLPCKVKCNTY